MESQIEEMSFLLLRLVYIKLSIEDQVLIKEHVAQLLAN